MKPHPNRDLLEKLGLREDAVAVEAQRPRIREVALGWSTLPLDSQIRATDFFANAPPIPLDAFLQGLQVSAAHGSPSVAEVSARKPLFRKFGAVEEFEGDWVLDGRNGAAGISFADGTAVLVEGGRIWLVDSPIAQLPAPDVTALLGGEMVHRWLVDTARSYAAAGSNLSHAVGAGLLGRLWAPANPREWFAHAKETPGQRAQAWFAAHPQPEVEQAALVEVGTLEQLFEELDPESVLPLLIRRDDVECVAFLLGRRRKASQLQAALRELDAHAHTWGTLWRSIELPANERLARVAEAEPQQWWAVPASRR